MNIFFIRKKFPSLFDYPETQEVSPLSIRREDKCLIHPFHLLAFRVTGWGPGNQICVYLTNMTWGFAFKLFIKVIGEMLLHTCPTLHARNILFLLANCNPLTSSHIPWFYKKAVKSLKQKWQCKYCVEGRVTIFLFILQVFLCFLFNTRTSQNWHCKDRFKYKF